MGLGDRKGEVRDSIFYSVKVNPKRILCKKNTALEITLSRKDKNKTRYCIKITVKIIGKLVFTVKGLKSFCKRR